MMHYRARIFDQQDLLPHVIIIQHNSRWAFHNYNRAITLFSLYCSDVMDITDSVHKSY